MKNKVFIAGSFAISAIYVILSLAGFGGKNSFSGGLIYHALTIVVLLYVCIRCISDIVKRNSKNVLFFGTLGLCSLAVNEIYTFVYLYIWQGSPTDITISNYSRNCVYLFFVPTILMLVLLPQRIENIAKKSISAVSFAAILLIIYGVIIGNPKLVYYPAISLAVLCALPAAYLFIQSIKIKRLENTKLFACSMLALSILDSLNRLVLLFEPGWYWGDIVRSFYPPVYLLIGFGLIRLGRADENG